MHFSIFIVSGLHHRCSAGKGELGLGHLGPLLGLLNLLLVGLDLSLQLVGELGHLVLVLVVLFLLELQLLDAPLRLLVALEGLGGLALDSSKLNLHLANATLQLGHGVPATLGSSVIGLSQPGLQLLDLGIQGPLALLHGGGMVLLSAQLVGKPGSINHGLLGLLLRSLGLVEHVIDLGMDGVNSRLQMALLRGSLRVDGGHVIDGGAGLSQLHVSLLLAPVSRVKESARLLQLALEGIGLPVSKSSLLGNLHLLAELLLQERLGVPQLSLVTLDGLVGLSVGLVGVVKGNLQLIDVSLQLLLDPQSLRLGTRFSLKGGLHGFHGTLVVFACIVKLLLLLMDLAVNH